MSKEFLNLNPEEKNNQNNGGMTRRDFLKKMGKIGMITTGAIILEEIKPFKTFEALKETEGKQTLKEKCYQKGEKYLEEGINSLNTFKRRLDEIFKFIKIRGDDVEKKIKKEECEIFTLLRDFFREKQQNHNLQIVYALENSDDENPSYTGSMPQIIKNFEQAIQEFDKAIKYDNTFIDAYLSKASVLCYMGRYSEAQSLFNTALEFMQAIKIVEGERSIHKDIMVNPEKIKFINPLSDQMRNLFYEMADKIMKQEIKPPKREHFNELHHHAEDIIMVFQELCENWIDRELSDLKEKTEREKDGMKKDSLEKEKEELIIKKVKTFFELAEFYIRNYRKDKAYNRYWDAKEKIEKIKNPVSFIREKDKFLKIGKTLISYNKSIINEINEIMYLVKERCENFKTLNLSLDNEIINPDSSAKIRLFDKYNYKDNFLPSEHFDFYFLKKGLGCFVKIKNKAIWELKGDHSEEVCFKKNEGENIFFEFTLPNLKIKNKNELPFIISKSYCFFTSFQLISHKTRETIFYYPKEGENYQNYFLTQDKDDKKTIIKIFKEGQEEPEQAMFEQGEVTVIITISPSLAGGDIIEFRKAK